MLKSGYVLQEGVAGLERGSGMLDRISAAVPAAGPSLQEAGESLASGGSGAIDRDSVDANGRSGSLPVKRSASTKSGTGEEKDEYTARVRRAALFRVAQRMLWHRHVPHPASRWDYHLITCGYREHAAAQSFHRTADLLLLT